MLIWSDMVCFEFIMRSIRNVLINSTNNDDHTEVSGHLRSLLFYVGLDVRKPVLGVGGGGGANDKVQTSPRISAD